MSLYHGYELLEKHGLRSLYSHLEALLGGEKGTASSRSELQRNVNVGELMDMLRASFQPIRYMNSYICFVVSILFRNLP